MKALFVLHESKFVYGANRSLSELLRNLEYDFDILICQSFTKKIERDEIRNLLGPRLQRIYICWLPRYRCCHYDVISVISEVSHIVNNFMALLYSHKRKKIMRQGNYNYIHLNSPVLFPILDEKNVYVMHVRDIINSDYYGISKLAKKMEYAKGIIYIDEATKISMKRVVSENRAILLNNPFNMLELEKVNYIENMKKYGLASDNIVFTMLGQVTENKGAKFVIRSFIKLCNDKSRLLIVGNNNHSYGRECREIAENDKRIIFCGELTDTKGIYRISDYILRGDPLFCIGRTIFEGLYAGCGVIMPGCEDDMQYVPDGEKFREKIFFYSPQKEEDLTRVMEDRSKEKQTDRQLYSNIAAYMEKYNQYISGLV